MLRELLNQIRTSDSKYKEAKLKMRDIYQKLNSNIPDYNPFELPFHTMYVPYPEESLIKGKIEQKGIKKTDTIRVYSLLYSNYGALKVHSHYGYWEYIFVQEGIFKDIHNNVHKPGDALLLDGFNPHSLECVSGSGKILILFSKEKKQAKFANLSKLLGE